MFLAHHCQFGRPNRVSQFEQFVDLMRESRAVMGYGPQSFVESFML
jgi:hypothetical protein